MPGLLTHIFAAIASMLIVHLLHFKWEYSWATFVGNFVPDVVKFGLSALKQGTWKIFYVQQDGFYHTLEALTYDYTNWFTLGFFLLGLGLVLYHFHYIQKKKMEEYDELYVFFLIGIFIHLFLDVLIIESSPWI